MDFNLWLITQAVTALGLALAHKYGIVEIEIWVPKWLSDGVQDLPDMQRFYE